jgi:hypothetical protein
MPFGPTKWYVFQTWVKNAVVAALSTPVPAATVVPGEIAWDGGDCGALYVSLVSNYVSDQFPNIVAQPSNCDPGYDAAEIAVVLVRCVPGPDGSQSLNPPPENLENAAALLAVDTWEMTEAVRTLLCSLEEENMISVHLMGMVVPVGPKGGIVGIELHMAVGLLRG